LCFAGRSPARTVGVGPFRLLALIGDPGSRVRQWKAKGRYTPPRSMTRRYQRALDLGVRFCVAKSTCTRPKRRS